MNNPAVLQLRLPRSIKGHVERLAAREGISMNQFIATAVAEKLSALETAEFFEERARRADLDLFDRVMSRESGEPPRKGDELPEGYVRPIKKG
ncbi:MAG: pilus assembly protein HicB [Novosphingobium sp.]|nr:pilus assembly protein HicB [Novosphingobium sp.]MBO9601696.1 pilus assembly protein HicB [Novosphingobium sp.]